ncbi:MAG: HupE/UreJ family protein [Bacteroidetes bacterium]|nr:HupE/UreJ family protein [Bacteroidota bacterium]MDA0904157.1 HupE/UreJ family protein [Bacteroidota bacterium]MDA1242681.1 HupE/UreJ family protein [Bacteroidota bacterium]
MNDIALGVSHITDWQGYDHMLFLLALVARYDLRHAGRAALVATAFTLGHSLTLAVASLDLFRVPGAWVEFLIAVTILWTALWNVRPGEPSPKQKRWTYVMAAGFGLIHGLGFSSFFRISRDEAAGFIGGLFRFNLGVELGQLVIVAALLAVASLVRALGVSERDQQLFVCGGAVALSLVMALERVPW